MTSSTKPSPNIIHGVILIIVAALCISLQDVVFKTFSNALTLWQIFALRGVLAVSMLVAISWQRGEPRAIIRAAFTRWSMLRAVFITTTFLAFYAAIPFLSLSTIGAANYIAPIFVALLSAFALKKAIGIFGWLGVVLGFIGVVILLQPGTDAFSLWVLLPVVGAAFYAVAHIVTGTKCVQTPALALTLSLNTVMLLAGLSGSLLLIIVPPQNGLAEAYPYIFGTWAALRLTDWLVIALLAGFTIVIGVLLARAYQVAPPAIVSTFEYSYLVFVALWDIIFFGIAPTFTSIAGMLLIVVAGLLVLRRK